MLNKTLIALSAAAVLASSSAAFASYTGYANRDASTNPVYTPAQQTTSNAGSKMTKVRHMSGHKQALKQTGKSKI
jgi:hypothetical protein